jgi:hypothetical protein
VKRDQKLPTILRIDDSLFDKYFVVPCNMLMVETIPHSSGFLLGQKIVLFMITIISTEMAMTVLRKALLRKYWWRAETNIRSYEWGRGVFQKQTRFCNRNPLILLSLTPFWFVQCKESRRDKLKTCGVSIRRGTRQQSQPHTIE